MPKEAVTGGVVQEAIQETVRTFIAHFARGDASAIARLYAEDAIVMPPNQSSITGRANIERLWKEFMNLGVKALKLETKQVEQYGDVIAEIGRYTIFTDQNQAVDEGKYLVLWKQEHGEWKLFRDIWNSSRPAAAH